MKNRPIFFLTLAGCVGFLIWAIYAWAGQITLTTYYPAPTGNYANLTVTGNTYLATSSGNVGIGNTNPGTRLEVSADAGTTDILRLRNTNATNPRSFRIGPGTGAAAVFGIYDDTAAMTRMAIDYSGNVGIGVTNPVTTLDILGPRNDASGIVRIKSTASDAELHIDGAGGNALIRLLSNGTVKWGWLGEYPAAGETCFYDYVGGNCEVTLQTGGHVSVLGNPNSSFNFYVNGTAGGSNGWNISSDIRWKKNIHTLQNPLSKLLALRGVTFDWRNNEFKDKHFPQREQIGFIAQEVEKEFPQLVTTDKQGYKYLAYDRFTAVLLEAIKAQQKEIENLNQKVNALQDKLKNVHQ